MAKTIYYATEDDLIRRASSVGVDWVEVYIIAKLPNRKDTSYTYYLVRTLDGSRTFVSSSDFIFVKTESIEADNETK